MVEGSVVALRKDNLTYKHHEVVAPLKPKEQALWLEIAERKVLTSRELKKEIWRSTKQ